eukprot:3633581-Prymnesium_polylepis.2
MLLEEHISADVVLATREYLRLSQDHTRANIDSLPASVRQTIREQRFGGVLASIPLMKGLSSSFVAHCIARVSEDVCVAGLTILRAQDISDRLWIILDGHAALQLSQVRAEGSTVSSPSSRVGTEQTIALLNPGASFGGEGFLCSVPQ